MAMAPLVEPDRTAKITCCQALTSPAPGLDAPYIGSAAPHADLYSGCRCLFMEEIWTCASLCSSPQMAQSSARSRQFEHRRDCRTCLLWRFIPFKRLEDGRSDSAPPVACLPPPITIIIIHSRRLVLVGFTARAMELLACRTPARSRRRHHDPVETGDAACDRKARPGRTASSLIALSGLSAPVLGPRSRGITTYLGLAFGIFFLTASRLNRHSVALALIT